MITTSEEDDESGSESVDHDDKVDDNNDLLESE